MVYVSRPWNSKNTNKLQFIEQKRAKIFWKSLLFLIPIATVFLFPNIRNSIVYIFVSSAPSFPSRVLFFDFVSFPVPHLVFLLRSVQSFRPSVPSSRSVLLFRPSVPSLRSVLPFQNRRKVFSQIRLLFIKIYLTIPF